MLCKTNSIIKYSFLAAGLAYLLSSTAMAQNTLSLTDDASSNVPNLEIAIDSDDELDTKDPLGLAPETDINKDLSDKETVAETQIQKDEAPSKTLLETPSDRPLFNNNFPPAPVVEETSEPEEMNNVLRAYNNFVDESDRQIFNNANTQDNLTFGDKIMSQVKEDLFSQMADIEKQTSLLTLELKRERIKNEISAMKAARQRAIEEEKEKQLEKERKQAEWEKEQERKLLQDQQKLKEMDIKYEKLRQERVLKAYKESMLKSNQEWVDYNARLYNQLVKEENNQNELINKQKEYFKNLIEATHKANVAAQTFKEKYTKEVANLQTQVAILKSKLEAEKNAFEESKKTGPNPFALVDDENAPKHKIAEEYAIMEISGKGDALVAKLINKNGGTFMVKPGTILNTGHVIEEITQTYITADKGGLKDYLYFSAGGILDKEPSKPINSVAATEDSAKEEKPVSKVPSLREGMFAE